jgi:hypothetical protein
MGIDLLFFAGALVCFLLASFKVQAAVDWTNLGFACLTCTLIF